METGNVTVGLPAGVAMLEGWTGKVLWQRTDLGEISKTNTQNFRARRCCSYRIIQDGERKTKLTAIDTLTGATVWQTDKMLGYTVEMTGFRRDMLVFLTIRDNRITKDKPDIYALKMATGELLWQSEYTKKVDLYGVEKKKRGATASMFLGDGGGRSDRLDLSGENPRWLKVTRSI